MDHLGRVSQDEYHSALDRRDRRIAELEAALTPFAEAYRYTQQMGSMRREYFASMTCTGKCTAQDFARAAELIPVK